MLGRVRTATTNGIDGILVDVEVDVARGLPSFSTVGLPEAAVRESRERVKSAIQNSGYDFPARRITVNLAPADLKKTGTGYDLPIAAGILSTSLSFDPDRLTRTVLIGELSLDGKLRATRGILPVVAAAARAGLAGVLLPRGNLGEASLVRGIDLHGVDSLPEAVEFLTGEKEIAPHPPMPWPLSEEDPDAGPDFGEVRGQAMAKRAMEIAAAGNHNLLLEGPPGSGKTMLARCLPSIMPPMRFEEVLESTKIYSVAGLLTEGRSVVRARPYRSPHHTISDIGLIGGGQVPRPGEISLAHNGVLFLDEMAEFKRPVLEVLRQPLEDRVVTISRASGSMAFPARFLLVAAMNPCPCGFLGDERNRCRCTPNQVQQYRGRLSGPLLDRIDIHAEAPAVAFDDLARSGGEEPSAAIRARVVRAREIQSDRFRRKKGVVWNSDMDARDTERHCQLEESAARLLKAAFERFGISARAYNRIRKIARTIADLAGLEEIRAEHVAEAIQFRRVDRRNTHSLF